MILYHYTSIGHLYGIGRYGLTVGDVPTNLTTVEGKIGVWLTSSTLAKDHGLEGSAVDKTQIRIAVELPIGAPLLLWDDWAPKHVAPSTLRKLETGREKAARTWYVYFGCIPRASIVEVSLMETGEQLKNWDTLIGEAYSLPAWAPWRRDVWQRKMLKNVRRVLAARQASAAGYGELW